MSATQCGPIFSSRRDMFRHWAIMDINRLNNEDGGFETMLIDEFNAAVDERIRLYVLETDMAWPAAPGRPVKQRERTNDEITH